MSKLDKFRQEALSFCASPESLTESDDTIHERINLDSIKEQGISTHSIDAAPSNSTNNIIDYIEGYDIQSIVGDKYKNKVSDQIEVCTYCGGEGLTVNYEKSCPVCGAVYKPNTITEDDLPPLFNVPLRYKNNPWSKEKALENQKVSALASNVAQNYAYWVHRLEETLNKFSDSCILQSSYLITAPTGFGKTIWLFSAISRLFRNGLQCTPIKILNDIEVNNYNMSILNESKVLTVKITKFNLAQNLDKLSYILESRKLLGLTTIVLSPISYTELKTDSDNEILPFDEIVALF